MPIVEVDGQEIEFPDDMGGDEIKAVLRKKFPPQQQAAPQSIGKTVLDQSLQGATFGFADEVTDRMGAGIATLGGAGSYSDLLKEARNTTKEDLAAQLQQNPGTSILSNLAGGLLTGGAAATTKAGAALGNSVRGGNLAARVVKGIAPGAATGGLYGAGTAEDGKRLEGAKSGAVYGAAIGGALPLAGAGLSKLNTKTFVPTSEAIRSKAGHLFKQLDDSGEGLSPEIADGFRNTVIQTLNLDGEAKLFASNPVAERLVNNIGEFAGKPMTFSTAKKIDEALGDLAYGTMDNFGKLDSAGKKFLDLQGALRESMENVPGNDALREARKLWSTSLRMRDIERIVERSKGKEQPVTIIKNGFSALLGRGDKLKGYTKEEIKAIQKAAETGIVTDAFKLAGSGLIPIGAAIAGSVSGPLGTALGYAGGFAAQQGAKAVGVARQMGRANNALETVAKKSGMVTKEQRLKISDEALRKIMKMPPAAARAALDQLRAKP